MPHVRLTSKRQATFPVETCEALGLKPGDILELEPRIEHGERLWLLRARPGRSRGWVGSLGPCIASVRSHSMAAIRRSIAAGRKKDGLA
jgi:bifunctional DNA-binding transcriptional regulator/antitoxin component of YhaV-PrlF toxin-antitoxin module